MENGTPDATKTKIVTQPTAPQNLEGALSPAGNSNQDWRVTLNRHDGAICVAFADGHCARVQLADVSRMKWTPWWIPYTRTNLPRK